MLRYDRWANLRWLSFLEAHDELVQERRVLEHVLGAHRIWIERVNGHSPSQIPAPAATREEIEHIFSAWEIELQEPNRMVRYRNSAGRDFEMERDAILAHAVNHGTYHRGDMRGMLRAKELEHTVETDLFLFLLERQQNTDHDDSGAQAYVPRDLLPQKDEAERHRKHKAELIDGRDSADGSELQSTEVAQPG